MPETNRLELRVSDEFLLRLDVRRAAFSIPRATMIKALVDVSLHEWTDEQIVDRLLAATDRDYPEENRRAYKILDGIATENGTTR